MDTILLIEDDADLLDSISRILTLANYKVIKAENGRVGLERLKENKEGLSMILSDIVMPELDGYGVFRACKNIPEVKGVPFIFLTAKFEWEDVRRGMDLGADDYLTKPFTANELLSLITARIKKFQETREVKSDSTFEFGNILFSETNNSYSEILKTKYHTKNVLKRNILFMEGDKSFYLYYIVKGKVKIFKRNEFGKEYITNIYKEGDFFGHTAFLDNGMQNNTAVALEDSEIVSFSKNDFLEMIANNKVICLKIMQHLSFLLNESEEKLLKIAYNSARKKVADAMIFAAKRYCKDSFENSLFSVSRDDLSALSGISPESVSRNLTEFKNEGLIGVENGQLIIFSLQKLESLKN